MKPHTPDDLEERILRLLDGEMSPIEVSELDRDLQNDRKARTLYLQLSALHSALQSHHASRSEISPAPIIPIERFLIDQRRRLVRFATIAAAALLTLSAVTLWLNLAKSPDTLASFQTSPEATYSLSHSEDKDTPPGRLLRPGSRLILSTGIMEAEFSSGVRCVIEAPCDITTHSDQRISVAEGIAWFHVPPAAKGFTVQTKQLSIIDLGTEFGVIAHRNGQDEIHVTKGSVEASTLSSGKHSEKHILKAGEARRFDILGKLVKTTYDSTHFPTRLIQPLVIRNPGFESTNDLSANDDKRGYGPIRDWATSGLGVGLNNESQPFLEQPAHGGAHTAFIQGRGAISQSVSGFDPSKLYTVTYFVSERGLRNASTRTSVSLDLGSSYYTEPAPITKTNTFRRIVSGPLHVFGPTANIEIRAQTASGDATLLIDTVSISRAVPAIPDGGFEMALLPEKQFVQAIQSESHLLQASPWKFHQGAGITHNGSAFAPPVAPEGSQAAILQSPGAFMETTVHDFEPGVTYRLSLDAAMREGGAAPFQVLLDDTILTFDSSATVTPASRAYQTFTSQDFTVSRSSQKLRIASTGKGTTWIDDIHFHFVADAPE